MAYVKIGQKEIKTKWPFTKGLTAETQTQKGRLMNLIPQLGTNVLKRNRKGM